jgi:Ca-activated chloride channel family protein
MHFDFGSPFALLLLLLIPCFFWCREQSRVYYFPKMEWIGKESPLLTLDPWMKVILYSLMVVALAEPFLYDQKDNHNKRGRDLILAIDASGSMAQSGFDSKDRFKTKYDAVLEIAGDFIEKRHDDNMGAVLFGTFAYSASPLTYDLEALSQLLEMTNVGIAGESTAIGDAITQSIRTLSFGKAKNKAIILLTDGYHNAGKTSPREAVKEAKKQKVKIYTIGIGKERDYDSALLQTIAKESGGKHFGAVSAEELKRVYSEIDKLEPSPIRSENFLNRRLLAGYPLGLAFALLLFWVLWQRKEQR